MPPYELSLIMKKMPKGRLVTAVKRTAEVILSQRGYIEKIECLESRTFPYRMSKHGQSHSEGSFFLIHYHAPFETCDTIRDHCQRDMDVIRPRIFPREVAKEFTCTLHDESRPPSYRAEVTKMIDEAEERLPRNLRKRKKVEKELENYIF